MKVRDLIFEIEKLKAKYGPAKISDCRLVVDTGHIGVIVPTGGDSQQVVTINVPRLENSNSLD